MEKVILVQGITLQAFLAEIESIVAELRALADVYARGDVKVKFARDFIAA